MWERGMATDRVMILRIGLQLLWLPKKRGERESQVQNLPDFK